MISYLILTTLSYGRILVVKLYYQTLFSIFMVVKKHKYNSRKIKNVDQTNNSQWGNEYEEKNR